MAADATPRRAPGAPDALIAEARTRWTRAAEAEQKQRERIIAAKKFRAGDQWPSAIKIAREGGGSLQGMAPQPPKPCLVVDRLSQPTRQTSNLIKQADFGFNVMPNGGGSDTDTAEIFKGYLRWIQNNSRGESPIEWAADGAIEGGLGWFRLRADYTYDTWDGDPNDPEVFWQELKMERITNALTVYCDPSAEKPTRSDAQWMFITEDLSRDEFKSRYKNADFRGLETFMTEGDRGKLQTWVSKDTIRIAEYWRIEIQERTFHQLQDGTSVEQVKGQQKPDKGQIKTTRVMRVPVVKCDKINAVESLEQYDWPGSHIPIIPVLGEELNVDGQVWLRGIIEEGMDAQRMINYTYSGAVEIFGNTTKNAPMIPAPSVANYKAIWQSRNIVNHAYLPYDPWDAEGKPYPPPILDTTEPPIQAAVELMRVSEDAVKATTSTGDASLGNSSPNERSGRALQALQSQSDLANSNYPDNVRRALIYAAELALEVIPKITQKGQIIHILGMDDEPEQVMAGQPFQQAQNGTPQALPDGITPQSPQWNAALHKFYDFTNGRYAATVTVGKANATKREEGSQAIGQLIPHLPPPMAAVATVEYVKQLSFPGAQGMAERLEKALPPELQPAPKDGQPPDPQMMQQQMQQMQGQLQQATQMIQTDQVKAQSQMQIAAAKAQADQQIAQLNAQKEIRLQEMKDATAIEVARISAAKAAENQAAEAAEERLSTGLQMAHEVGQAAMDHQHAQEMAQVQAQNQSAMAAQQAGHAADAQAGQQSHDAEMQQQAQDAAAQAAEQAQSAQGQNGGGQ